MCVKTGLLYVGAEFGDHQLYQFQGIGDDEGAIEARSVNDPELGDDSVSASQVAPVFKPTPLKNLVLVDESESAAPTTDLLVADLADEGQPQLHALCGRGARASLRVLRYGVAVRRRRRGRAAASLGPDRSAECRREGEGAWVTHTSARRGGRRGAR